MIRMMGKAARDLRHCTQFQKYVSPIEVRLFNHVFVVAVLIAHMLANPSSADLVCTGPFYPCTNRWEIPRACSQSRGNNKLGVLGRVYDPWSV